MAFWTDANSLEPLRQNRWYIYFGREEIQDFAYAAKEVVKPHYKIETTQHVLINHTFNYPKNLVWQPITIKMVTARNHCNCKLLTRALDSALHVSGYSGPHLPQTAQIGKYLLSDALKALRLHQVDENGIVLEVWELANPMITDIKYGSLSYEQEGFVDVDLSVVYDYAIYVPGTDAPANGLKVLPINPGFPDEAPVSAPSEYSLPFMNRYSPPTPPKQILEKDDK
jgi:hypothetical protein